MDIVDAQVHFNLLDSLKAGMTAMDAVGVNAVLYDEYWGFDEHSRILPGYELPNGAFRHVFPLAEEAALRFPERFAYLVRFDRRDPQLEDLIATIGRMPQRKALRVVPWTEEGFTQFAQGADEPVFAAAQKHRVPVFVLLPGRTSLLRPYLHKFPDVPVIIDHCGVQLPMGTPPADRFAGFADVLALAEFSNVSVKWSHAPRLSREGYPYPDVLAMLLRVVEAFTPQRVMWGSDHTQSKDHHSWAESLYYIRDTGELSSEEKAWILGRSLRTTLNWPAPTR
ncbi:amidohydrolase family protein [Deinococcus peraridilitoris]|uniref:Putative TIM-barrel fold metal-dependent hydrolase n=1 Tax=Deinococcus peraridilitoris (strain DSM 19664 / LMG 22246 / CIP 109416 / KR-200) TaxID=937777 RepID=L0A2I4_DEIPD|nr:amidohydrolase family protein [Deinococcus peraridilitoris]AFZ67220.1 putative TIM-barrel fold metal-dependent hydrolase [Deinococcus peraridilitoris DSM 19664]